VVARAGVNPAGLPHLDRTAGRRAPEKSLAICDH